MAFSITILEPGKIALAAIVSWLVYTICISIYRLFLHPLRRIPGPRLAALTLWVETYYECFKKPGGQFMWEYQRWHEKYGPIVHISPNEVHIQDVRFYDTLYSNSRHSDKLKHLEHRFNNRLATFATAEHSVHRMRRAAVNPFFSKRKITQQSSIIQQLMNRLCNRLQSEFLDNGSVLNLSNMWGAFTGDIVVGYCLEEPYNFIEEPEFRAEFSDAMVNLLDPVHFITQFPWLIWIFKLLPDRLIAVLSPPMASVHAFNKEMERQILRSKAARTMGKQSPVGPKSLFTALLESDLPGRELSTERLQHEAIAIIGAGIETTTYALSLCSYHVLSNAPIAAKLRAELMAAIPDPREMPRLDALTQLPYLTCVINEALRFAYGTPQRIPRLSPTPMVYGGYDLPVGSVVSMDNYTASHDPWAFDAPFEFRPERWEDNPRAADRKPLTAYLVAFGRGTRSCVGMQLAYADLYIGLATFFRRFTCELTDTERDAVDCYYDSFVPRPKPGTRGVRVKLRKML
ncbi:cytochrome P450 [Astrocystis sublimbata]|nr:cytochrome P450 [Astrocystis sublimbata]